MARNPNVKFNHWQCGGHLYQGDFTNSRTIFFYESTGARYEYTNFYARADGRPLFTDTNGIQWKTTEHYFQAQKFWLDTLVRK